MNEATPNGALEFACELLRKDLHLFERHGTWLCYGKTSGILEILDGAFAEVIRRILAGHEPPPLTDESVPKIARLAKAIDSRKVYRQGVDPILSTQLNMTDSCNMGCSYCYGMYYANDPRSKRMSEETAVQCVDFSHAIGARAIGFFGGEPLLNLRAIRAAVEHSRSKGYEFEFSMTTNGVSVTEDVADFLADFNFTVSVSVDGPREVHGTTRTMRDGVSNSFDRTWRGVELLKERGLLYMLEMTYSMKHPEDLKPMLEFLAGHSDHISCTCVEGRVNSPFSDEIIKGRRLIAYYNDMFDFYEQSKSEGRSVALAGINEFVMGVNEPVATIREHVCSSLLDRVSIGYEGTVYPCPETMKHNFAILNVFDTDKYHEFEASRELVLDSLKKRNLQDLWFGNFMDFCIGRVTEESNGQLSIDDVESISEALEESLHRIATKHMHEDAVPNGSPEALTPA